MAETISIAMNTNSDGAWRSTARVALLLIAGLTASAAPRSPFSAPAPAAAAIGAVTRAGQIPDSDTPAPDTGDTDDTGATGDDQDVPIPVFEDEVPKADSTADSTAVKPSASFLPILGDSAAPETLRYVPPGEKPPVKAGGPVKPGDEPAAIVKKPKQGLFGLPPIFVILGLTAVHVFVVKAVTD